MQNLLKRLPAFALALIVTLMASAEASAQANIVILNGDAPGVGFNDTTAATPVGGNSGTTLGQQRLIAFQAAANIWGANLVSGPPITIRATWAGLACTSSSGTLASAGNNGTIYRNFSGGEAGFWYGVALANALSNIDRNGAAHEINTTFNMNVGTPGCFDGASWYYGLDNNHGSSGIDLVSVALHEFAHGLGFATFTSRTTGEQPGDDTTGRFPSIYDKYLFDNTAGKSWPQMTNAERVSSAINTGNLVWIGPQVLTDIPNIRGGVPRLRVNTPASIAGIYQVGTASFGPELSPAGTTADVVQTIPNDGCSAISNSVAGKVALIDRGNCNFTVKAKTAQNAGASGVVIVDNVSAATPPGMSGTDNTIVIPTVSITLANGNVIKGQLSGGVNATLLSESIPLAGTDVNGRPRLYAPNPLEGGSSVSHWDAVLSPNQLMEPSNSGNLLHAVVTPSDLTYSLFRDLGWNTGAPAAPMILLQQGTADAVAFDSVTQVKGPFTVLTSHNFSGDTRRRLLFFTTDLGLSAGNTTGLSVQASGIDLPVENAGPGAVGGTSYVIVRLPDLPPNTYALTVRLNNRNSTNAPTIQIVP